MKVLVEASSLPNDLFYTQYEGTVIAETEDRYLVRHHLFFKSWVPKHSPMMRCMEIKELK